MMLKALYENAEEGGDLTIMGCDGVTLKCHKNILTARSPFFQSMFEFNDNMDDVVTLDFESDLVREMLSFIYTH